MSRKPAAYSEVVTYWRGVKGTLKQRGLLRQKRADGTPVIPCAQALVLPDRVVFVLDMNRLAGIPREKWLDRDLWLQLRATLRGRRCFVADSAGLALVVAREPGEQHRKRLPHKIPLTREELPDGLYTVTLGHEKRGPVILDLADDHRAILIGGASGGGKTNGMQVILTQLALKRAPDELQLAIVDTKEVDFSGPWAGLPQLFQPIAHNLDSAAELIELVEAERVKRQAAMARAGVSDWRRLPDPPPLLVLLVDEAADFQGTAAMDTLTKVARKGRAFGVSVILGTQYPTSKVIDPQIKANLPTAIAFQCRTGTESKVVIDRTGAELLDRPGLALTFVGGRWRRVQVLRADDRLLADVAGYSEQNQAALEEIESELVSYAIEELGGAFTIGKLYDAHAHAISKHALTKLGRTWQRRGWLTEPEHATAPRFVTEELKQLALMTPPPPPTPGNNGA